jgi:hypothetical protein
MKGATTRPRLAELFDATASRQARTWLTDATAQAAERPERIDVLFASAARACGREALSESLRTDTAARVLLLTEPTAWGNEPALRLYEHGTADERLAVLLALDIAATTDPSLLTLTRDALRSNDTRLITAALGPFAAQHLQAPEFRQAVLKCAFCGVPFDGIAGLSDPGEATHPAPDRADTELARVLAGFARERVAAGRTVPDDIWPVLRRFPDTVADSGLLDELSAPDALRAAAARQALDSYHRREKR